MKYWGVFGQFLPDTKYEPELISIWTDKTKALKAAKRVIEEISWVQEISINSDSLFVIDGYELDDYKLTYVKGKLK